MFLLIEMASHKCAVPKLEGVSFFLVSKLSALVTLKFN